MMNPRQQTVLSAGQAAGFELPYSCKAGMCCTCRCLLVSGEVEMDANYSLEPWEIEAGFILSCQARPKTKALIVDFDNL
jgi:ring-1,2-phenylacetyl-CoA epoxidase subunit PaaE